MSSDQLLIIIRSGSLLTLLNITKYTYGVCILCSTTKLNSSSVPPQTFHNRSKRFDLMPLCPHYAYTMLYDKSFSMYVHLHRNIIFINSGLGLCKYFCCAFIIHIGTTFRLFKVCWYFSKIKYKIFRSMFLLEFSFYLHCLHVSVDFHRLTDNP